MLPVTNYSEYDRTDHQCHIHLRHKEDNQKNAQLPTANTCINRMYLPRYESIEILESKLRLAIEVKNFGFI